MHTSKATVLSFESRMENVVMNVTYSIDDIYPKKKLSGLTIGRRGKEKSKIASLFNFKRRAFSGDPIYLMLRHGRPTLSFLVVSWQRLGNDLLESPQEASYSTKKHTGLTERKRG